ncbi:hypothetical protein JHK82_033665 [Glycine max]|nr:hypothetical protein JHK85_034385 [Glycine max]KAG5119245.1 hypothetical protein JHK82_033665 [Glycine max]KAG5140239.1 hypothetical protein JHK84_034007 [Glycine max]
MVHFDSLLIFPCPSSLPQSSPASSSDPLYRHRDPRHAVILAALQNPLTVAPLLPPWHAPRGERVLLVLCLLPLPLPPHVPHSLHNRTKYMEFGLVNLALKVFNEMPENNSVSYNTGLEQHEQRRFEFHEEPNDLCQFSDLKSNDSRVELSAEAALQAKPKRYMKQTSKFVGEEGASHNIGGHTNNDDLGKIVDMPDFQESEDADWTRTQDLIKTGDREDVELVSCNTKGFIVSFGSLVGFLPYHNLASKWKFLAFESWLKQKGIDPSIYKQNSGTITSFDAEIKNLSSDSPPSLEIDGKVEDRISPDMKLEDLLRIYDQEKLKFLSSFVG